MASRATGLTPGFRSLTLANLHTPPRALQSGTPDNVSSILGLGRRSSTPTTPTTPRRIEEHKQPMDEGSPARRTNGAATRTLPSPRVSPARVTHAANGMGGSAAQPMPAPAQFQASVVTYGRVVKDDEMEAESPSNSPPRVQRQGDLSHLQRSESPDEFGLVLPPAQNAFVTPAPHAVRIPGAPVRPQQGHVHGAGNATSRRLFPS